VVDYLTHFEWQADAEGYRLADAEPAKQEPGASLLGGDPAKPLRVIGRSGRLKPVRPFERRKAGSLFADFANIATSPEGVLKFLERHGPLTKAGLDWHGEPVPDAIEDARIMQAFIRAAGTSRMASVIGPKGIPLAGAEIAVVANPKTWAPMLRFSPSTLLDALWLELAFHGYRARVCRHCGDMFSARKADAIFCSPEHRVTFNSLKRSQPAEEA
jgi:hypothetical protein